VKSFLQVDSCIVQRQHVAEDHRLGYQHAMPSAGRFGTESLPSLEKTAFGVVLAVSLASEGPAVSMAKQTY